MPSLAKENYRRPLTRESIFSATEMASRLPSRRLHGHTSNDTITTTLAHMAIIAGCADNHPSAVYIPSIVVRLQIVVYPGYDCPETGVHKDQVPIEYLKDSRKDNHSTSSSCRSKLSCKTLALVIFLATLANLFYQSSSRANIALSLHSPLK